ncbi:MAG: DUF3347 domain-containing protein [Fibrobacterales bacterium]
MKVLSKIFLVALITVSVAGAQDIMTKMYGNLETLVTISEALASDDFKAAQASAATLNTSLTPSPSKKASPTYKAAFPSVEKLNTAKDIAAFREAFKELNATIIPHVKMYGGLTKAKLFECKEKKVQWLQKGDKPRNPYFGKKMLSCGTPVK